MRRVRIGIIGAGAVTEWAILPALSGPDAVSPPDTGAWWSRRPTSHSSIHYQAPALPEVVALADSEAERAERVGQAARVRAIYKDWRVMLREVQLDALLCVTDPVAASEVAAAASSAVHWLWIYGPPATTAAGVLRLDQRLAGRAVRVWCARPLRYAAAHRVARQMIERDEIGPLTALTLRWGTPLYIARKLDSNNPLDDTSHLAASYAAFDFLLGVGAGMNAGSAVPTQVAASETRGTASVYTRFANEINVLTLCASAESWNSTLPRLEICGTQGRSIICEAGRRLWLHKPHEPTRWLEPPGMAAHISTANIVGVAEDLKAFLTTCIEGAKELKGVRNTTSSGTSRSPLDETSSHESWPDMLSGAARALQWLEVTSQAIETNKIVPIASLTSVPPASDAALLTDKTNQAPASDTLPLHL